MPAPGRKSKLTTAVIDAVLASLRTGSTRRQAALAADISESTFHAWLAAGRQYPAGNFGGFAAAIRKLETERLHSLALEARPPRFAYTDTTFSRTVKRHGNGAVEIVETTTVSEKFKTAAAMKWLARHWARNADFEQKTVQNVHNLQKSPDLARTALVPHGRSPQPAITGTESGRPSSDPATWPLPATAKTGGRHLINTYIPSKNSRNSPSRAPTIIDMRVRPPLFAGFADNLLTQAHAPPTQPRMAPCTSVPASPFWGA